MIAVLRITALACATLIGGPAVHAQNTYTTINLVANSAAYSPQIVDPLLIDGWGITLRPPGAGGHFWITNTATGTTTTYVGDVAGVPLHQDALTVVDIPPGLLQTAVDPDALSQPAGQVYAGWSNSDFVVSAEGITGASKFIFATLDGTISGWRDGMTRAVTMVDQSAGGSAFFGIAVTQQPSGNRLYVADFGLETVSVYNDQFQKVTTAGDWRAADIPPVFVPWNLQYVDGQIIALYARLGDETREEEHYPGYGYVAAFDLEGRHLHTYQHGLFLNAPWGIAVAPDSFGPLAGKLLVANFADGTIVAFDRITHTFVDYLRGVDGQPLVVDGVWGMVFGNGVRLGYANHLYFAAGPNGEENGVFGKIVWVNSACRADVSLTGGAPGHDGLVTVDDLVGCLSAFFGGDQSIADVASPGGQSTPDGALTVDDLVVYLAAFFGGCSGN
ncbi:MAG: TIGR03118 family protein [Phycisphaerales bacterium]